MLALQILNFPINEYFTNCNSVVFMSNIGDGLIIQETNLQQIIWKHGKLEVINYKKSKRSSFVVNGITTENKYKKFVDRAINRYTLQTLFSQNCIPKAQTTLALSQFFISIIRNAQSSLYLQDEQSIFIRAIIETLAQITPQSVIWKTQKLLETKYPKEQLFYDHFEDGALILISRIHVACQQYSIKMPELAQNFIQVIVEQEHKLVAKAQSEMAVLLSKTNSEATQ